MRIFTKALIFFLLIAGNQLFAQWIGDNPNLDQIPQYLRERASVVSDAPLSTVITIDNWDNFSLGVDFAENNMAEHPSEPSKYFTAYNTNAPHRTDNGIDWFNPTVNFGASMSGDPVVAYDSIGNLFYENMYGATILGCKVVVSTNNGQTWGTSVTSIAGNDKNWIACDQTSGPYANYAYTTMTNNGVGNFARSMDHGATWTSTFAPSTQSLPGMMPCVGPDGNTQGGAVYVVTNSGSSFAATYTFYRSTDGGATFQLRSSQQWANTVGTQVNSRNSVSNMRTRPYPMVAADNSYGANRGKLYCVYASNDPPGNNNKSDVWCRASSDGGSTWGSAVKVNDGANVLSSQQWHPAIWCDKETGKLYAMWMDTRDTPTNDSAFIYASYSTDGGLTWVPNQRISNKKMKIDCASCGGGGTPRYEGDYNGVVSNKKVSMLGWADFRSGNFTSMTAYFPDFAMAIDHTVDTLYTASDYAIFQVSIPEVKLYSDTVVISGEVDPAPATGTITFEYPSGNIITGFPATVPVKVVLTGNVPVGTYGATFFAKGPNGTPAHSRKAQLKIRVGSSFLATPSAVPATICQGQTSQLNVSVIGGTAPFNYVWAPAESLNNPAIQNPVATPSGTTTYKVTVTDNAAHTAIDSVTVTVNTPPPAPGTIIGSETVCAGSVQEYSVLEVIGATGYSWTVPPTATIVAGQNSPNMQVQWGGESGNIVVKASNDCGSGIESVLPVIVNIPPANLNPITGPDAVCTGTTASFTVPIMGPPDTFNWTVPADATIASGQGTNSITVTWGTNAGVVSCYAINDCGQTPEVTKSVGILTIPAAAGTITGKDTVCMGHGNLVYSVDAIAGATQYVWTLPTGASVTSGQGTNQVTILYSNTATSGAITVKGENTCGTGLESTKNIVVKNCAGIGENGLNASISIFPNPVSGELTISISGNERKLDITITDATGRTVYGEKLTVIPGGFVKKLDMSTYAKGIYLIKITNGNGIYSEKLIVR